MSFLQRLAQGLHPSSQTEAAAAEPAPSGSVGIGTPIDVSGAAATHQLLSAAGRLVDARAAHLWLEDLASGTLRQLASAGPMSPSREPVPFDDPVIGAALSSQSVAFAAIRRVDSGSGTSTLYRWAFPVLAGEFRGVAAVDLLADIQPDPTLLDRLRRDREPAIAAGLAVDVARSETDTARALADMARDLSRVLSEGDVVATCLDRALRLSAAATGSVMLLGDDGKMRIVASHGLPEDVAAGTSISSGEGIAGWVLATEKPVLVEDLPGHKARLPRHGVRSALSVPIADENGTLGVLNVGSRTFPARFTQSHMNALETLGRQTCVAIRNARALSDARDLYFATLRALALAMETKDPYAPGGTDRVVVAATAIGGAMGLPEHEMQALEIASLLHDIGMSAAGDVVVVGGRPLSTIERGLLKMHPVVAAEILEQAPALHAVVPIVYHHHEWFDGRGYVNGVSGDGIPLGARILAVADAYVAMTSDRPYRRALTREDAVAELTAKAGTQFDPEVVEVFVSILRSGSERVPEGL